MAEKQQTQTIAKPRERGQAGTQLTEAQVAFKQLRAQLDGDNFRNEIASAIPKDFKSVGYIDTLCEGVYLACRDNPDLLKADRASLFREVQRLAKRGLPVGDNQAWLVPYKGQVQSQVGYAGAMTLVRRSGIATRFACQAVYANDKTKISLGTNPAVLHEPPLSGDRGDFIGVYAIAWVDDQPEIEWMSRGQVEKIRTSAPSANSPAWKNWYEEMARGKVVKRLCKRLPKERPIDLDDMDERLSADFEGEVTHVPAGAAKADVVALMAPGDKPINTAASTGVSDAGRTRENEPAKASAPDAAANKASKRTAPKATGNADGASLPAEAALREEVAQTQGGMDAGDPGPSSDQTQASSSGFDFDEG